MTILFLTIEYNFCCGISRSIHSLSAELVSRGYRIIIGAPGGTMISAVEALGIEIVPMPILPEKKRLGDLLEIIRIIRKTVTEKQVDLVHSHHRLPEMLVKFALLGSKVPTVATVHALVGGKKLLSFRSDKLFAVSNAIVEMLTCDFSISKDRIELIRNIPRTLKEPSTDKVNEMKTALGITQGDFVICGVGRLHQEKGFDLLVQAIRHLQHLPIKLLLVGNGPEKEHLKNYVEKHELKVSFLNEVKEVELIYSIADLVVVPSRLESAGLVAIEASAFSKPVIATNVGGLVETIQQGKTGILIPPESPKKLTEAIQYLYNNREERVNLGNALNYSVREKYNSTEIVNQVELVYRTLKRDRQIARV
ncbi:glycosyltransferase family 4 protein [Paracnuella aquatica]|uniref:glycosyltransferase family 4 protein n=1 Tax=Paracnuella aquatica TaxID=2268757 RepID=UPI000DEEAB45|nr:glycosyltransferase family 4 protein [Paracnuella aquatica]RPD51027.1 glycosyltransferase family 1 protein [Paracnuella aquatica]